MADTPQTLDEVDQYLKTKDYSQSAAPTGLSANPLVARNQAKLAGEFEQNRHNADRTTLGIVADAVGNETTANLLQSAAGAYVSGTESVGAMIESGLGFEGGYTLLAKAKEAAAADFTPEKFNPQFKKAMDELGPEYTGKLIYATDQADYDRRLALARSEKAAADRLSKDGLTGTAAQLIAGLLDPASLAAGAAGGEVAVLGAKLAQIQRASRIGNAVHGVGFGLSMTGAKDAVTARDVQPSEYLAAAALGGVLEGTFGRIAKNPALAQEAAATRKVGEALAQRVEQEAAVSQERIDLATGAKKYPTLELPGLPKRPEFPAELPKAANDLDPITRARAASHEMPTLEAANDTGGLKAANDVRAPEERVGGAANQNAPAVHAPEPEIGYKPQPKPTAADDFINALKGANENAKVLPKEVVNPALDQLRKLIPANEAGAAIGTAKIATAAPKVATIAEKDAMAAGAETAHPTNVHRYPEPKDAGPFKFLSGTAEKLALDKAGPVIQRLRAMGIDVRAHAGSFKDKLVSFATTDGKHVVLDAGHPLPASVLGHEEIHALVAKGGFEPGQYETLLQEAKDHGIYAAAKDSASVREYRRLGAKGAQLQKLIDEEAVAGLAQSGRPLSEAAQAIMDRIRSGELAQKIAERDGLQPPRMYDISERARNAPTAEERQFLSDTGLKDLKDSDVARTFTGWGYAPRLDIAGWLGASRNKVTRVIGDLLFNDTVGKIGHATNGFAAELVKTQLYQRLYNNYDRIAGVAYSEWAQTQGMNMWQMADRSTRKAFNELVGKVQRGLLKREDVDDNVVKAADAFDKHIAREMAEYLKNPLKDRGTVGRPVYGAQDLEPTENYFTRRFHQGRLNQMIADHGFDNVAQLVANAIRTSNPDLEETFIQRIATGYLDRAHRAANGVEEDLGLVLAAGKRDELAGMLREYGLSDQEIGYVTSKLIQDQGEAGVIPVLKKRTLLDEGATFTAADGREIKFSDMLVHDADEIAKTYLTRAAGRVALAQAVFKDPATGEVLINGITNDAEFEKLLKHASERGGELIGNGYNRQVIKEELDTLRWGYDRLLGRPMDNQQGQFAQAARLFRSTQLHKLINVGFSQMAEMSTILGSLGLKAALPHFGDAARTMFRSGSIDARVARNVLEEMEHIAVGVEGAHSLNWQHGIDTLEATQVGQSAAFKAAEQAFDTINKTVFKLSGMPQITDAQQKWAGAAIAQKIFNAGKSGFSKSDYARFGQLGLSREMLDKIGAQIAKHGETQPGLWSEKLKLLNLHKWDDREASAALQLALFRGSRKMIQSGDIGMSSRFMSDPVVQLVTQFKTFSIQGWANHTLYNLHQRDFAAAMTVVWGTLLGGSMYALQTQLQSVGRGDREKFLQDRLGTKGIVAGAFQRNPLTSILPMLYDSTVPHLTNTKSVFDTRGSGNASSIWLSPPALGAIDALTSGVGGAVQSMVGGRQMSQGEIRSAASIVPFSQWIPVQQVLSSMIANRPTKAPKPTDIGN